MHVPAIALPFDGSKNKSRIFIFLFLKLLESRLENFAFFFSQHRQWQLAVFEHFSSTFSFKCIISKLGEQCSGMRFGNFVCRTRTYVQYKLPPPPSPSTQGAHRPVMFAFYPLLPCFTTHTGYAKHNQFIYRSVCHARCTYNRRI